MESFLIFMNWDFFLLWFEVTVFLKTWIYRGIGADFESIVITKDFTGFVNIKIVFLTKS